MEKFDAVVVGAGPAGSAAARTLAQRGFSTLLVERGNRPGQKTMYGGRIYAYPLEAWYPDWRKDCPVERFVVRESMVFTADGRSVAIEFESPRLADAKEASFTALRSKFDEWMAKKAEEAGAMLVTGIRVDELWREGGRVRGVVNGKDKVAADLVVLAEGAVSSLVRQAGMSKEPSPEQYAVGVKETIELPPTTIEDRFGLDSRTGAAYVHTGDYTRGCRGGGFLYTNRGTISLGLVISSQDLGHRHVSIADLMDDYKALPSVAAKIRGGKTVEYSAHLVPELGGSMSPKTYSDNVLVAGDAAGFLINNGYTFRGVDLAIASGVAAGEAAARARKAGGMSATNLSAYPSLLRTYNVLTDLETFGAAPSYLKNPRLFTLYPELVVSLAERVYRVDGKGKGKVLDAALEEMRQRKLPLIQTLRDLIGGARAM